MLEWITNPLVGHGLLAGFLTSVSCGLFSVFTRLKRIVFVASGIGHIAFFGVGLAYFFGFSPFWGGFWVCLISSVVIGIFESKNEVVSETLLGILWSLGFSLGILLMHWTPGYAPNMNFHLFGNILLVDFDTMVSLFVVTGIQIVLFCLFYKEYFMLNFDQDFLKLRGVPVDLLNVSFYALLGVCVFVVIQLVGIVLAQAMLSMSSAVGMLLSKRHGVVIFTNIVFNCCCVISGLLLAYFLNTPPGPSIVCVSMICLAMVNMVVKIKKLVFSKQHVSS